jgi:hypothetical protein
MPPVQAPGLLASLEQEHDQMTSRYLDNPPRSLDQVPRERPTITADGPDAFAAGGRQAEAAPPTPVALPIETAPRTPDGSLAARSSCLYDPVNANWGPWVLGFRGSDEQRDQWFDEDGMPIEPTHWSPLPTDLPTPKQEPTPSEETIERAIAGGRNRMAELRQRAEAFAAEFGGPMPQKPMPVWLKPSVG